MGHWSVRKRLIDSDPLGIAGWVLLLCSSAKRRTSPVPWRKEGPCVSEERRMMPSGLLTQKSLLVAWYCWKKGGGESPGVVGVLLLEAEHRQKEGVSGS